MHDNFGDKHGTKVPTEITHSPTTNLKQILHLYIAPCPMQNETTQIQNRQQIPSSYT